MPKPAMDVKSICKDPAIREIFPTDLSSVSFNSRPIIKRRSVIPIEAKDCIKPLFWN